MTSFNTMKLSDVLVVFVVFLGLFVEYLQYSGYIAIIGFIVLNSDITTYNNDNDKYFYIGLLFSCQSIGYLLTINFSYKVCIFFGYFIPMIISSLISIWFTLLFSWNLNNYLMLIICRIIIGSSTTILSTSQWIYILYVFNHYNDINTNNNNPDNTDSIKNISNITTNNNNVNLNRNFVAKISYFSISIAWIIGPLTSLFLYSYNDDNNDNDKNENKYSSSAIYPFYALVGVMILHLFLFLITMILSFFRYSISKNWNWNKIKLFCMKQCCICYHCNITCKYITFCNHSQSLYSNCCHINCSWKWNNICCCFNNDNCCSSLFKRSRKNHMRARFVLKKQVFLTSHTIQCHFLYYIQTRFNINHLCIHQWYS